MVALALHGGGTHASGRECSGPVGHVTGSVTSSAVNLEARRWRRAVCLCNLSPWRHIAEDRANLAADGMFSRLAISFI